MQKCKTIIVENDETAVKLLQSLLNEYFPNIEIAGVCTNVSCGLNLLAELKPDIIFLDIELDDGLGFELIRKLPEYNFKLIVTTGFNHYAVEAFEMGAIHYLLKPISPDNLKVAITRALKQEAPIFTTDEVYEMIRQLEQYKKSSKITISSENNKYYIEKNKIIYLEADGSYTHVKTIDAKTFTASLLLKEFEYLCKDNSFYRISRSYIINIDFIKRIKNGINSFIEMKNGMILKIPRRNKQEFNKYIVKYIQD